MELRQEIFDTYWKFAARRQEVFFNRIKNLPPPWTSDPILNEYKFCNAYRASDRVSQYLIKHIIYDARRSQNEEEVIFRILLFKIFNKIETWAYLESRLGAPIELSNFDLELYSSFLQEAMDNEQVIYTSAYMMTGVTKEFGYNKKHQNHLALISKMVLKDRILNKLSAAKSLQEVFVILVSYPLIGNFLAYQLATDINYSEVIDFDENSFTMAGPGAERGIGKCFLDTGAKSNAEIIYWMTENQEQEFQRLGIKFPSLWGHPLKAIDCQNLFCEVDKYCRVAVPELKSNRKRLRSRFSATTQPIEYFYPPKWNINDKVRETLAERLSTQVLPQQQPIEIQSKKKIGHETIQELELFAQLTDFSFAPQVERKNKVKKTSTPRLPIVDKTLEEPEIEMKKDAKTDSNKLYRYWLLREWNPNAPRVVFVMLNPSVADADIDDPTLRKCIGFAKSWGYGSLELVNLFAYIATEPDNLRQVEDPVGSDNDSYLLKTIENAEKVILAWGDEGSKRPWRYRNRSKHVLKLIGEKSSLYCLGLTEHGHPRHPLYVDYKTTPVSFELPPLQLELNFGILG